MNIITLQSDYPILSLSRLSAPVQIVEKTLLDIRWVEGLEGELVEDEAFVAPMLTEEEIQATVWEEDMPVADSVDEEPVDGTMTTEEGLDGIWECD